MQALQSVDGFYATGFCDAVLARANLIITS